MPRPAKISSVREKLDELVRLYREDRIPEKYREIVKEVLESSSELKPN